MTSLGGEGGGERLAHAGEGGLGFEGGAAIRPFQLEGGGRQIRPLAEGHHAGEASVGAQLLNAGALGVVEIAGADDEAGRAVDFLAEGIADIAYAD